MNMKPILFNTEMVTAILDGRKTVTRRIADINTEIPCNDGTTNHEFVLDNFNPLNEKPTGFVCRRCGFGVAPPHSRVPCGSSLFRPRYWPGDILYVRETWCKGKVDYGEEPDGRCVPFISQCPGEDDIIPKEWAIREDIGIEDVVWRPSIHMPKEAARIFLRVTKVRVERLQAITDEEAAKEGVPDEWPMDAVYCPVCKGDGLVGAVHPATLGYMEVDCPYCEKASTRFANLWNSTIKPADLPTYGWDANPWVWVIKFEKISKEEATKC